ncbi:MAG: efflux RND transporter periplasmic adaptor subunit [Gemmataceae bacterium]|nr:efflux RND transporter periplasmic adaptor subunit [Gemmataceae bacterium]
MADRTHHPRLSRRARLAVAATLTVAATVVLAHEGHAPLPTKGAQVDVAKGHLLLTPDARASVDVRTVEVTVAPVEARVLAYATVVAPWRNHGFVTAGLPGRISKVLVAPGQAVRAGDPLAEVQSLDLDTLQLDLLAARNEIRLGEKTVAALKRVEAAGSVAGQAVIDAENKLQQDRNALDVARAKWLGLGLPAGRLDELLERGEPLPGLGLPVRSPVSGTVAHAELTVGKVVEPAEHLAEVVDLSTVWVRIGVLEKDLHKVAVGQGVELRLVAYPGEVFRTAVKTLGLYLDPTTHVNAVWAELVNPPGHGPKFVPGMAGQAYLVLPPDKARPSVPAAALQREGFDRFVLVEEASAAGASEYRKKSVAVGRRAGDRVELLGGEVFPGDRVVTQGAHELGGFFTPGVLRLNPEAERTIGLRVEPAESVAVDEVVELDGLVDEPPDRRGFASSPLAGTVRSIRVDRGQAVRPGDVVAEVYSVEFQGMQLDLLKAHLEHSLAAGTLARVRGLAGVAQQRVWELESRAAGLKNQIDMLRRKLVTAGLGPDQVDRLVETRQPLAAVPVRAPLAGVVVNFDKVLGQAVAAHEPLFEVHDLTRPWVQGFVPERDTARVRVGQPVRVRLVSDPGFVAAGRVARSGGSFGADSRANTVWVEFDRYPDRPLRHAQMAGLTVVVGTRPPAVAVPKEAVAAEGAAAFVFVRRPDGVFDRRAVETGAADDRFVTVTRGLSAGEPVAVAGVQELMTAYAALR